jgi:hypothetical protein
MIRGSSGSLTLKFGMWCMIRSIRWRGWPRRNIFSSLRRKSIKWKWGSSVLYERVINLWFSFHIRI